MEKYYSNEIIRLFKVNEIEEIERFLKNEGVRVLNTEVDGLCIQFDVILPTGESTSIDIEFDEE